MKISKALAVVATALACSPVMAQSALQDLGLASGVDAAPMIKQAQLVRDLSAAQGPLAISQNPKDVLESCSALEAKPFVAWNVKQAALMVQTCLNHSYTQDASTYRVQARVARFSVPACPQRAGALSCQAIIEVEGIEILVDGKIMTGNPVLNDLNYALQKRGGKLLGFYGALNNKAEIVR